MNKIIQLFLERLTDRITGLVGSVVGSTAASYRIAQQAQLQSFLEDLARQYEAEGKPELATSVRQQAARLHMDDPAAEARPIIDNLLADRPALPSPDDTGQDADVEARHPGRKRRRRATRPATSMEDDLSP